MECPDCGVRLEAALILETRDDERPVSIDHQWWRCPGCGARFFAVLVEDKTNIFNDELEHTGYRPDPAEWEETRRLAALCPSPRDKRCDCAVHEDPPRALGPIVWSD